ncbi:MAG: leucine-rich repeat domain-containing protein [Simkaniaceae bacterium]|nr:leucine-rich repeat domain-containing protein [Simkaniaceae bacterium]
MAAINQLEHDPFLGVPSEVMQQILIEAEVHPSVAIVCKRWRNEIRDMSSRTFSFIVKIDQKNLTEEQIQKAKILFIKAVIDHRRYYPTQDLVIHPDFLLFSLERYNVITADVEPAKRAADKVTFWRCLLGGTDHIDAERIRIPGISDIDLAVGLSQWIQNNPGIQGLPLLGLIDKKLYYLPEEIGCFSALKKLDLSNNKLTTIPKEIGNLTVLEQLNLKHNQLIVLPAEIGKLTALTALGFRNNQLTALPKEIGKLTALTALGFRNNQLTALPKEIGNLTALAGLDLTNNPLTVLPGEIWKLTALKTLGLENTQLTVLPATIWSLTALRKLSLSKNQLTVLPGEIWKLTALEYLYLSKNQLTELPVEIGGLTGLKLLHIAGNSLKQLPGNLARRISILGFPKDLTLQWERDVQAYQALSVERQHRVHEWIRDDAGKPPGDDDFGRHHLLDDLEKFHKAMLPFTHVACNLL